MSRLQATKKEKVYPKQLREMKVKLTMESTLVADLRKEVEKAKGEDKE